MGWHRVSGALLERAARKASASGVLLVVSAFLLVGGGPAAANDDWDILSVPPRLLTGPTTVAMPGRIEVPVVTVSLLAVPLAAASGDPYVSVLVELEGSSLLQGTATDELRGRIDVAAVDTEGVTRGSIRQPFVLTLDQETRSSLEATGLKLFGTVRVPPGPYRLEAAVLAGELGAKGEGTLSLSVPALGAGEVAISPPLVPHGLDRWKAFQQSEGGYPDAGYAFVAPGGAAFMPSARPAVARGSEVDLYLIAYGGAARGLSARVVDGRGNLVAEPGLTIEAREPGDRPREERLRGVLSGLDVPRGFYTLEIAAGEARSTIPIDVVAPASATVAGDAMVAPQAPREVAETEVEVEPIDPRQVKLLESRYARIVASLEGGRFEDSARQLVAFEKAVLAPGSMSRNKALGTLREAQGKIADELARESPESLYPVLYLHFLADDLYQAEGGAWSVAQNRAFVAERVQSYAKRGGAEGSRRGAQLLAALGVTGVALELQPDNALAILRDAIGREKAGQYRHALPLFERLVALQPRDPHGRLRLGVNLRRLGDSGRAADLLRSVIDSDGPTWMRLIAYQQLADLELQNRARARAEALLRQGIDETGDQSLQLQLAYLLDRARRRDEAIAVLNRVTIDRINAEPSARHRYNGQPNDELTAARAEILANALGSLPALRIAMTESKSFRVEASS